MAQLKQLSAGSSQIIMMMFRDKNNAPIKADSVHVKGSIFTGSGKPFEFEVNKGVCTNCKIQNDMLLFNIVPLLGLGQMQVYTQTFLGDAKAITGTYISENQQKLGVEVVQKGTFLSDRHHSQFSRASQLDFWLIQTLMMAFICKAEQTENLCLRLL